MSDIKSYDPLPPMAGAALARRRAARRPRRALGQEGWTTLWRYGLLTTATDHANPSGVVHGGVLMAFADHGLSFLAWEAAERAPCTTIQLNTHFLSSVRPGAFLELRGEVTRRTRGLVFLRGLAGAHEPGRCPIRRHRRCFRRRWHMAGAAHSLTRGRLQRPKDRPAPRTPGTIAVRRQQVRREAGALLPKQWSCSAIVATGSVITRKKLDRLVMRLHGAIKTFAFHE